MGEGRRLDARTPPGRDGNDRGSCRKGAVCLSYNSLTGLTFKISGFMYKLKYKYKMAIVTF